MTSEVPLFKTWTDGISADYLIAQPNAGRFERGRLTVDQIKEILLYIQSKLVPEEGAGAVVGIFINAGTLEFSLNEKIILASNPQDPNFQNIAVSVEDVPSFILGHLQSKRKIEDEAEIDIKYQPSKIRLFFYALTIALFLFSIFSIWKSISDETHFLVVPNYKEIKDVNLRNKILNTQSGIFASGTNEGDVLLQILADGDFVAYDLWRNPETNFLQANPFTKGTIKPVRFEENIALISDTRFFFYPIDPETITFLERDFYRIGLKESDIPNIAF